MRLSRTHRCRIAIAFDEQVSRVKITVDPDGWAEPCQCLHGILPGRGYLVRVDRVLQRRNRGAGRGIQPGERRPPEEVVLPGRWATRGVDPCRAAKNRARPVANCPGPVYAPRCSGSRPPASHKRTTHRDTPRRAPLDERDRDGKGQERSESRKPVAFLLRCAAGPLPTG